MTLAFGGTATCPRRPDRGDAIAFDDYDGVRDRGFTGAVDQRPAFED